MSWGHTSMLRSLLVNWPRNRHLIMSVGLWKGEYKVMSTFAKPQPLWFWKTRKWGSLLLLLFPVLLGFCWHSLQFKRKTWKGMIWKWWGRYLVTRSIMTPGDPGDGERGEEGEEEILLPPCEKIQNSERFLMKVFFFYKIYIFHYSVLTSTSPCCCR